jgi:hypothetical protein
LNFLGQSLGRNVADFPGVMNRLNGTFSPLVDLADSSTRYLRQLELERNYSGTVEREQMDIGNAMAASMNEEGLLPGNSATPDDMPDLNASSGESALYAANRHGSGDTKIVGSPSTWQLINAARNCKGAVECAEMRGTLQDWKKELESELAGLGTDRESESKRVDIQNEIRQTQQAISLLGGTIASARNTSMGMVRGAAKTSMDTILAIPALIAQSPAIAKGLWDLATSPIETGSSLYEGAKSALTSSWEEADAATARGEPGRAAEIYTQQGLAVLGLGTVLGSRAMSRIGGAAEELGTLSRAERIAFEYLDDLEKSVQEAHFLKRHGPMTTLDEQQISAATGLRPDKVQVPYRPDSSRWFSHADMVEGLQRAEAIYARTGNPNVTVQFDRIIGEGYLSGGEIYARTNVAVFKFNTQGKPVTFFPLLDVK